MLPDPQVAASATVHPSAQLGPGVVVGPGVVIEAGVQVGADSQLLVGSVLHSGSVVGARCRIGPYAIVAGEPMDTHFGGEPTTAVVEDEAQLREFVTLHRATGEGNQTRVGRGALVMSYAHVSHNSVVGAGCVLTTGVQLGGHSEIGDYAVLGAFVMLHQHCRVGKFAMVGASSATNKDLLPFVLARGNLARHYRLNAVGLKRHGVEGERYRTLERALRLVRQRDLAALAQLAEANDDARELLDFVTNSKRGVARFVTGD